MTEKEYNQRVADCQAKSELKSEWVKWGIKNFASADYSTWFGTLTYRNYRSPEAAKKDFIKWLRVINIKRFGKKLARYGASVSWMLGQEYQARGQVHFHNVIKNTDALMRNWAGKAWWDITGGYGKILPSAGVSAVEYIGKYISKDGQLDIDIRDDNTGQRLDLTTQSATEAERGRAERLKGFSLPLDAN